ncbi:MAG: biopolymer transporter ExbD [Bryobacteraceae bacterium]|jgi:biopolymer transport protein TolR
MGMAVGGAKGAISSINMTPMIDVLLVLIIIFMVITPLTPKGLEALVPQPPPPGTPPQAADTRTVVIVINKDKSFMINQDPTPEANLGPRLEEIFKTRAERVVFVKGDPDLEFQYVAKAIDIAHGAGIDKVGLMTPQMEAGQ